MTHDATVHAQSEFEWSPIRICFEEVGASYFWPSTYGWSAIDQVMPDMPRVASSVRMRKLWRLSSHVEDRQYHSLCQVRESVSKY